MALESTENATNSINGDRVQYWDFRVGVLGPSAKVCFGSLPLGGRLTSHVPHMSRGGLIAFDDIDFARPGTRMHEAWTDIAATDGIVAAVEIQGRLGLVELGL